MSGKNSLRYQSTADMPGPMRQMAEQQLQAESTLAPRPYCPVQTTAPGKGKSKYGNVITVVDGIRFDSKREATYYGTLKARQAAGEVEYFLRQVPIHLPGGTKLVVDFLVFFADRRAPQYIDVKGKETDVFRLKKREVEHHYPIKVQLA